MTRRLLVCLLLVAVPLACRQAEPDPSWSPPARADSSGLVLRDASEDSTTPPWVFRVVAQRQVSQADSSFVPEWGGICWAVSLSPGREPIRVSARHPSPAVAIRRAVAELPVVPEGTLLFEFLRPHNRPTELVDGKVVLRSVVVPYGVATADPLVAGTMGIYLGIGERTASACPADALLHGCTSPQDIIDLALKRAGIAKNRWREVDTALLFSTWSVVESDDGRVREWRPYGFVRSLSGVLASIRWAAGHLADNALPDGSFDYSSTLSGKRPPRGSRKYNLIRHAGASWILMKLYRLYGWEWAGKTAKQALDWLWKWGRWDGERFAVVQSERAKLGAQALALLSLVELARAEGLQAGETERDGLCREILARQDSTGFFLDPQTGLVETSVYYPAEACLALAELGILDGGAGALDAAARGVKALRQVPTKGRADNWLPQAVEKIHSVRPEAGLVSASRELALAIVQRQYPSDSSVLPDYWGGLPTGGRPRGPVTAAALEGLGAAITVLRRAGEPSSALERAFSSGVGFLLRTQVLPEESFLCLDPNRSVGGFRGGLIEGDFRIDFDQHAIAALLWADSLGLGQGSGTRDP